METSFCLWFCCLSADRRKNESLISFSSCEVKHVSMRPEWIVLFSVSWKLKGTWPPHMISFSLSFPLSPSLFNHCKPYCSFQLCAIPLSSTFPLPLSHSPSHSIYPPSYHLIYLSKNNQCDLNETRRADALKPVCLLHRRDIALLTVNIHLVSMGTRCQECPNTTRRTPPPIFCCTRVSCSCGV